MPVDIEKLMLDIRDKLSRIEEKLADYPELKNKVEEAFSLAKQIEKSIEKIEDNNKWLWRTTFGSVIVALVALFFKFSGLK